MACGALVVGLADRGRDDEAHVVDLDVRARDLATDIDCVELHTASFSGWASFGGVPGSRPIARAGSLQ